ncbi:ABC transporter ATP-binding protein [Cupriavidus necator]|uniref:ABC transporter ATP-binding protein n=1 Tax=Cupriavidus necator TaxID=106590 RepID=UPI00339D688B
MLEITDLVLRRDGRTVVNRLSLAVPKGCVYALLGGNGAGKTTTIDAALGFITPAQGTVLVDGLSPADDPAGVRRRVAYLPENVALYPYLSGLENLHYFCAIGGIRLARGEASALLERAGLPRDAHGRRVAKYSKGMRQKVGLAIAQAKAASLMLLDEPTSGLDPAAADDMARRVRQAADAGMAVLMATHDLFNAKQLADRIGILRAGVLVAEFDARTVDHEALALTYLAYARGEGIAS